MIEACALRLFGTPTLQTARGPVVLLADRPSQLLCLLAGHRRWMRRDELGDLIWPAHEASKARSNLRKVLLLASDLCGDVKIERRGDLLCWRPPSDLEAFDAACDERRYDDAIELGAERLLDGFDSVFTDGNGLEWLHAERARVATRWQAACLHRLGALVDSPHAVIALADRMLARDPLDQAAVEAAVLAQLRLGQIPVARQLLESHRLRLANDLDTEPNAALLQLEAASRSATAPSATEPWPDSNFVGRRAELEEIAALMARQDVRVVTLVGIGGIGKSATARHVLARFGTAKRDASSWVELSDLDQVEQVPARIATSIGLELEGDGDSWAQIAAAMNAREALLVLDNAEHLELSHRLASLLAAAPNLKLLITSRSRLDLPGEATVALDGLQLPDEDEADVEILRRCESVILFEARARAVAPGFDLAGQAADVVRLLHLIEGMPLAIELTSAWTRLLPAAEIAAELRSSLDVLEGDVVASERGLRGSFLQSWKRLKPVEREVLARLAWLPGEFGRDMAAQVCATALPVLLSLVDKSLVRTRGKGRFSMHLLLRRCALEQLPALDPDDMATKHAAFVASWLGTYASPGTPFPAGLERQLEADVVHIRAAWDQAARLGDAERLAAMVRALAHHHEAQGTWSEGLAQMQAATQALDAANAGETYAAAQVWRGLCSLQYRAGDLRNAEMSARRTVRLAKRHGDAFLLLSALNILSMSLWQRGAMREARPIMADALRRAIAIGQDLAIGTFSGNLALIDKSLGDYPRALEGISTAIEVERRCGNWTGLSTTLNSAANIYRALGRPDESRKLLNEALLLANQHHQRTTRSIVTINLGMIHGDLGDPAAAREWIRRGLDEARQCGEPLFEMVGLLEQAHLDAVAKDFDKARAAIWQALGVADRCRSPASQVECVAGFGELLAHEGKLDDGAALMRWALAQPSFDRLDRDIAQRRLDAVAALNPSQPPANATLADMLARVSAS